MLYYGRMLNKQELGAIHTILSRQGIKVDITEVEAIVHLKSRVSQEIKSLEKDEATPKDLKVKVAEKLAEQKAKRDAKSNAAQPKP